MDDSNSGDSASVPFRRSGRAKKEIERLGVVNWWKILSSGPHTLPACPGTASGDNNGNEKDDEEPEGDRQDDDDEDVELEDVDESEDIQDEGDGVGEEHEAVDVEKAENEPAEYSLIENDDHQHAELPFQNSLADNAADFANHPEYNSQVHLAPVANKTFRPIPCRWFIRKSLPEPVVLNSRPRLLVNLAPRWQIQQNTFPSTATGDSNNTAEMIVERKIVIVTEQHNIDKPPAVEGYPMKEWTVELYLLDQDGKKHRPSCFHKVIYHLHPSFENPDQTFYEPPFRCTNEGWGEFEMTIDLYTTEKGGRISVTHDLNFAEPTYESLRDIQLKNPSQALQAILRETGPLPLDDDRKKKAAGDAGRKKKAFDVEKMADALPKLEEDELLRVIQLINDMKDENTYILNDPSEGEFSVDLYTLPDQLGKMLWQILVDAGLVTN